jgi:peptidoglycan/xylan/chitin deacetylase (PgdA/CDA1 family)
MTMNALVSRRVALASAIFMASPLRVFADEPDRRAAPQEVSAIRAAEFEARALRPPPPSVDIPILVYHHVVPDHSPGVLYVTPDGFEQQLKYLRDNDYQSVSFTDLADCLEYGAPLPERPVILSFDDGWENQFAHAFPLLQQYGFTATFYVVTNYLDHQNFMTVDQLRTLMAAGMTIGAHTRSHPPLASIGSPQRLKDEIAGSKIWLEQQLGVAIDTFAYPYGSYTASVAAVVKETGYRTARTVDTGTHTAADNLETLPGIIFAEFMSRNRATIALATGDPRR